jgi:hypothetical protein
MLCGTNIIHRVIEIAEAIPRMILLLILRSCFMKDFANLIGGSKHQNETQTQTATPSRMKKWPPRAFVRVNTTNAVASPIKNRTVFLDFLRCSTIIKRSAETKQKNIKNWIGLADPKLPSIIICQRFSEVY